MRSCRVRSVLGMHQLLGVWGFFVIATVHYCYPRLTLGRIYPGTIMQAASLFGHCLASLPRNNAVMTQD